MRVRQNAQLRADEIQAQIAALDARLQTERDLIEATDATLRALRPEAAADEESPEEDGDVRAARRALSEALAAASARQLGAQRVNIGTDVEFDDLSSIGGAASEPDRPSMWQEAAAALAEPEPYGAVQSRGGPRPSPF